MRDAAGLFWKSFAGALPDGRWGWSVALGVMIGCSGTTLPGTDAALLEIQVVNEGASVHVDGRPVRADDLTRVEVSPGVSRVEVRADGYLTRRYDAEVDPGDVWSVVVELWPMVDELDGDEESGRARLDERDMDPLVRPHVGVGAPHVGP